MKKFLLAVILLTTGFVASAQNMAKEEGESIATFLSLNAQQKQAVIKLYDAEESKIKQNRVQSQRANGPSKADIEARERAAARAGSHASSRSKVDHSNSRAHVSSSEHALRAAYGRAQRDPALQSGLKQILTPAQFTKWNTLGNH